MLVKFLGASAMSSVENGLGDSLTVNPGDVIEVAPETRLWERYPDDFELIKYGSEIRQKYVTLTSAQVLALNTTPVALVSAPGAGYFIDVLSIVGSVDYDSAAYATNTTLEFRYTNGSGTKVTADMSALITATADKNVRVLGIEAALVPTANAAVVVNAATGDPTDGDSPVSFLVTYRVTPTF